MLWGTCPCVKRLSLFMLPHRKILMYLIPVKMLLVGVVGGRPEQLYM